MMYRTATMLWGLLLVLTSLEIPVHNGIRISVEVDSAGDRFQFPSILLPAVNDAGAGASGVLLPAVLTGIPVGSAVLVTG